MDGKVRRSRRPGTEVERAVLRAAADELAENGYDRFTMNRVAMRAGTNKSTIYRRWPSRASLALAGYRQLAARPESPPDTGDLRSDVITLLRTASDQLSSPVAAEILRGLMADAHREPELMAGLRDEIAYGEPGAMLTVLARAVARGQARQDALTPRIATVAMALLRNEYLMQRSSRVSNETIAEIVDLVFLPLVRPASPTPRTA
ncbi:TetR/AcrR family transcriptional regulator [Actinoallomurus sp. NBC_01490]|uniref:TetR/AcrR family transcriptional regulator n=1 Tax=Actinoallomurus sp. NBC_01490 TaxID=2903557 RepID=UPI002E367409|nr:TetR/AcrR family transcriptional regulator [Actinoallomurus sp. NBC_01490]